MEKNLPSQILEVIENTDIPKDIRKNTQEFYKSYLAASKKGRWNETEVISLFETLCKLIKNQLKEPYTFPPFHLAITSTFNYYEFGLKFIRPILDMERSSLKGLQNLQNIKETIEKKENVILLSNHQTEIDPQIISLLIEPHAKNLAQDMIFVAGHRVTTDPLAVPLSLGRNLLCIYSKKYIDQPPEKKTEKLQHNQRTLKIMEELLREGGKCIYVAPSGGRDRKGADGKIQVAPFDPDSIEMFYLIAQKSGRKTHFHTLALSTYEILPPPSVIHKDIGEERITHFHPAHLFFGSEIDMTKDADESSDRHEKRRKRADKIMQQVENDYALM